MQHTEVFDAPKVEGSDVARNADRPRSARVMTYRSLSRYSPDFIPDNEPAGAPPPMRVAPSGVPIRFRHIALLLVGGIIVGVVTALIVSAPVYVFSHSKFALSAILGICVYGAWIIGYHRLSQNYRWTDLRTRFAPVGKKPLVLSALGGIGLVVLIASAGALLSWAGVKVEPVPSPDILPRTWSEVPLAVFVIVFVGPIAEELIFRGLLLDWLKQKINVWTAAVTISVIFSLLHNNPFSMGSVGWLAFTHRCLLGLIASALTIKYRSLRPSLVMHGTMNAIACITTVFNFV
jgi:membrane protease YdiL (CAAX protease family)